MDTVTYILSGGVGERLSPLTLSRSKPSVPFGGIYRLIDFTLTNCTRSDLRRIYLLTQYRSESLQRHLSSGWNFFNTQMGEFILPLPPQMRFGEQWYQGTADAIFQNLYGLQRDKPARVLILSGDHIYRMDYRKLMTFHLLRVAEISIVTFPVAIEEAKRFGCVEIDDDGRIIAFHEKPSNPPPIPGDPTKAMVNMGVYLADTSVLAHLVSEDARNKDSSHDFGKNIFPNAVKHHAIYSFPFPEGCPDDPPFWMDVGTVDSYYDVSMDMLDGTGFRLHNSEWPAHTYFQPSAPAHMNDARIDRSLVSPGCTLTGCTLSRSILSPGVTIGKNTVVENSILFDGVEIGSNCHVMGVIADKYSRVPDGTSIGPDPSSGPPHFYVTAKGVKVLKRGVDLGRLQEPDESYP
ncbi:MAG TPA: sugar phosphate nucleotidyltransferase [Thermoanaerobaculia bacterium]|nr:sugar phosphate nucleotidyltransferase [Thermoanaerobaculia bacterium]HUM29889.1 sugar phosphate nucleotidyltransferase [Thermoanaerobaculia bacterium]HXK68244.1 sugar phosphate nucleotidyltransferase [Thermoanaerobaculia bacterium]